MAFYVLLVKQREDPLHVVYRFGPDEQRLGLLRLDKTSGVVDELEPAPVDNQSAYFTRAAVKVRQHWKQQSFPDKTCWAS